MSRKPIHVKVSMPVSERLRFLFSRGTVHILLQPTTLGSVKVVDVIVAGKSRAPKEVQADAIAN